MTMSTNPQEKVEAVCEGEVSWHGALVSFRLPESLLCSCMCSSPHPCSRNMLCGHPSVGSLCWLKTQGVPQQKMEVWFWTFLCSRATLYCFKGGGGGMKAE